MNIKFLRLLIPRYGKVTEALFEVGDREIKVGVNDRFLAVCKSAEPGWTAELFLKQFGELIIRKMLAENSLFNYTFEAGNFTKTDYQCMGLEEIKEKLENDIAQAKEKRDSIGFKT